MDPTNNPTPTTPSPEPTAGPAPNNNPAGGAAPVAGSPMTSGMPEPPVVTPSNPIIEPSGATPQPPVNPIVKPTGLNVTDPIMMPEKPEAPDPVEEELKAPMKAAGPVPGSIGSAVSGPTDGGAAPVSAENPFANDGIKPTPSVSFNDPAVSNGANPANPAAPMPAQATDRKKTNKTTLIALIAVAAVIVIVLVVVLIMQLGSGGNSGGSGSGSSGGTSSNNGGGNNSQIDEPEDDEGNLAPVEDVVDPTSTISCSSNVLGEDGNTNFTEFAFGIADNKLVDVKQTMRTSSASGELLSSTTQVVTFDAIMNNTNGENTNPNTFIDADGNLLVSSAELTSELQNALNSAGGAVFVCQSQ